MKDDEKTHVIDTHNKKIVIVDNWECGVSTTVRHERNNKKMIYLSTSELR